MKLHGRLVIIILILGTGIVSGQVATGTPPFGSFGGGPFDTVNLGNLNVHFSVPIINKAGRGTPFTYNLNYDSSIWTPVTTSGTTAWTPSGNWGWQGQTAAALGYVTYGVKLTFSCPISGQETTYSFWIYHDQFGVSHFFNVTVGFRNSSNCPSVQSTASATATDGSGLTINATDVPSATIVKRNGAIITPPFQAITGAGSYIDSNGNEITTDNGGHFFDTLSSTTAVLTVSGSGTPASPTEFQYTAPSGTATYKMNYTQYTVATNFGFSTIKEYGPLSNALVSGITLPDGSAYTFTYEVTSGSCTPLPGTYNANCVTGRIASVTLPTLGVVSYTYTGGTNSTGIYSDGSTAGMTRTLNPGGEWQYSRSLVSGSPGPGSTWTMTVIDPNNNYTVTNAAEDSNTLGTGSFYETQRQIYQGSASPSNLLITTTICYNAAYLNCAGATVGSPITQTDAYRQLPNGSTRLSEVLYNGYGLITDEKEYNYGVTTGSAPGTTDLVRETATSYASLGNEIVNKPSSVTVYDWTSGTKTALASSTYAYDQGTPTGTSGTPQHTAITGSRGNLTTFTASTSATASLSQKYTYYDTGNPYVATDINNAQTTYVYGSGSCGNSFATTINEPLNLSRSITWNCTGGVTTQVTDENGNNVTASYTDPDFWRPASTTDQMLSSTSLMYSTSPTAVEASLGFNSGTSVSDSRTTADGFGRAILSQRLQAPGSTTYDTIETDYNNSGLPSRSTMPFSASAGGTNSSAPSVNTTYDALGRVLTATDANGGQISYTYTNNDVLRTVSGTQTFKKQFEYDGLGRLASVCEMSTSLTGIGTCGQQTSQTGYWTKYTYDALGHLLTVTRD